LDGIDIQPTTPGIGKTHLAIGLGIKAAYSVLFDTASNWIARLGAAHHANRLETELKRSADTN
jgi:DNA replication protein DnaC